LRGFVVSTIERMTEYGTSVYARHGPLPVYVPPLVAYVPPGKLDEVPAWLLALRLSPAGTWDCYIGWTTSTAPLNGHPASLHQELGWVPATAVRKLVAYERAYDSVPRLH
jgi:hypothetical protein